ncbi:Chaperone protein dnaJ [Cryptotrichosporon argae]
MEGNKEEALRCLSIAQRHRSSSNLPSALKFARKSVALYETAEGLTLVSVLEREIETGGSGSGASPAASGTSTPEPRARASGVEEHVSSAHARAGKGAGAAASAAGGAPKREYTAKQVEVVKRVKMCKHHQYYEILSLERTCSENDVKKAYKKLALALHPDKNGAPGADEAFKMVSKAFQVLSDTNMRAAFDANPGSDPTQRGASGMSSRGGGGGGMRPGAFGGGGGFEGQIDPEDLFNMFFGGGMGGMNRGFGQGPFGGARVYTFGGPPRRRPGGAAPEPSTGLAAFLPIVLIVVFALISVLPSLFAGTRAPDPEVAFAPAGKHTAARNTWQRGVEYFVDPAEWAASDVWQSVPEERRAQPDAAMFSLRLRRFESAIENSYIHRLDNECQHFQQRRQDRIASEAGIFGWGADYDKIREIRAETNPACEQLRAWGLMRQGSQGF